MFACVTSAFLALQAHQTQPSTDVPRNECGRGRCRARRVGFLLVSSPEVSSPGPCRSAMTVPCEICEMSGLWAPLGRCQQKQRVRGKRRRLRPGERVGDDVRCPVLDRLLAAQVVGYRRRELLRVELVSAAVRSVVANVNGLLHRGIVRINGLASSRVAMAFSHLHASQILVPGRYRTSHPRCRLRAGPNRHPRTRTADERFQPLQLAVFSTSRAARCSQDVAGVPGFPNDRVDRLTVPRAAALIARTELPCLPRDGRGWRYGLCWFPQSPRSPRPASAATEIACRRTMTCQFVHAPDRLVRRGRISWDRNPGGAMPP